MPIKSQIQVMREQKKREWTVRGYSAELIVMALDLADNRARGEAAIVPGEFVEARDAVLVRQYPRALMVAEKWLEETSH